MMMYVLWEGLIEGRLNLNQSTESDVVPELLKLTRPGVYTTSSPQSEL